jgi:hypothetical protein
MKKILFLFALIATFASAQTTIAPVETGEFCPNKEYVFTLTLPDNYSTLNASGGATITQFPSGSGTSVSFKVKFHSIKKKKEVF